MAKRSGIITEAQRDDIINTIMELIADDGETKDAELRKQKAQKVLDLLEELDGLFATKKGRYKETVDSNLYQTYATKEGWADYVYQINRKTNYNRAYQIITEILDILRDSNSIGIEIYKVERDSNNNIIKMTKHTADRELDLPLSTSTTGGAVNYLLKQIENQQIMEEAFVKHYDNFAKLAKKHYQKVVSTTIDKKTGKEKIYHNFNEGHIIEAYRRHLIWNGHNQDFSDPLDKKHVAIMLWYSLNNVGWWAGGDVGYTQVKGDNTRLATYRSIREVSTIFLNIIRKPEQKIDVDKIKKLFSLHSLEEIADPDDLINKNLDEFVDEVNRTFIRKKK